MEKTQLSVGDITFEVDAKGRVIVRGASSVTTIVPANNGTEGTYAVTVESGSMSCWFMDIFLTGDEATPLHNARPFSLSMAVDRSKNLTEVFAQDGIGDRTKQHLLFSSKSR